MRIEKYLLSIEEFLETERSAGAKGSAAEQGEALFRRAFSCVDETRRGKAAHMRQGRARAVCLGAGLLLRLAVGEALRETERDGHMPKPWEGAGGSCAEGGGLRYYSASRLLELAEAAPVPALEYVYGEKGKPYFKDLPFYFSISHSGDYVLCVLSGSEVGADIQICRVGDAGRLARRFFSEEEAAALGGAGEEGERLFFRLWTRKEAYGKLTGEGLAGALDVDLLTDGRGLDWEEYEEPAGYRIAVCGWGRRGGMISEGAEA